jgi:NAD(P)-dependent dehydrogenase (short-subunit alcohol dehydrogenase family)
MSLSGRGIVVGGGTGDLGRAVVAALLEAGARVAIPYRSAEAWDALRASVPSGAPLWGSRTEIAEPPAARRFVDESVGWLGRLDGVAALAGAYAGAGPLHEAPEDEWTAMLTANLQTAHALCRAAVPHLRAQGGSIVTIGSRVVDTGGAGAAAYAVSKAGVVALTRALAAENRAHNVRANCLVPAVIDTPGNRAAMPKADRSSWTPPEALARIIVFLLSPASAPLSGAVLPAEGPAAAV